MPSKPMHERSSPTLLPAAGLAALLLAVLATGTALTRAQTQEPAPPAATEGSDATVADEQQDADSPAPDAASPGPLEDYEASEQISEDLSVAFPVDI